MPYNVGDLVVVINNLSKDRFYNQILVNEHMLGYRDKIVQIRDIIGETPFGYRYSIYEDDGEWTWTDDMFRPYTEITPPTFDMPRVEPEWVISLYREYGFKASDIDYIVPERKVANILGILYLGHFGGDDTYTRYEIRKLLKMFYDWHYLAGLGAGFVGNNSPSTVHELRTLGRQDGYKIRGLLIQNNLLEVGY